MTSYNQGDINIIHVGGSFPLVVPYLLYVSPFPTLRYVKRGEDFLLKCVVRFCKTGRDDNLIPRLFDEWHTKTNQDVELKLKGALQFAHRYRFVDILRYVRVNILREITSNTNDFYERNPRTSPEKLLNILEHLSILSMISRHFPNRVTSLPSFGIIVEEYTIAIPCLQLDGYASKSPSPFSVL